MDGDIIEVSTGYFADKLDESGEFEGEEYDGVQINLRPDHLAILPNTIGACSVDDGCGFPRTNADSSIVTYNNMIIISWSAVTAIKCLFSIPICIIQQRFQVYTYHNCL